MVVMNIACERELCSFMFVALKKTNTTSPLYIMANIIKQQVSRSHHTKLVNKHNNYKMCTCISQIKVSPQCATPRKKAGEILNV